MRVVMIAFPSVEYTIELTEALAEFEEVMLMLPKPHALSFGDVIDPKVTVYPFYYPRMRYPTNLIMVYKMIRKIKEFKPDIIHIQRGNPWFNFALPLLKQYCIVTTTHNVVQIDWPSQRIPAFTFKPPIKYADQLIVHGRKLKQDMVSEFKRAPEDIHILPRGVNSVYTRYIKEQQKEEPHTIMYFGRIWEYKGIDYLIKAEPLISQRVPDVKIVIAGEGEDFQKYRDMMVHEDKFIVYNEYVSNEMVNVLFQKASIVVLPYIDGSQSGVIPLAYAFRKPVVITDVGSLSENVDNGVTGYIVPPRDTEKLAEAIIDLLINEEKRKKMGENAYKKTKEDLSWKNIALRTIEVYKKALSLRNSKK